LRRRRFRRGSLARQGRQVRPNRDGALAGRPNQGPRLSLLLARRPHGTRRHSHHHRGSHGPRRRAHGDGCAPHGKGAYVEGEQVPRAAARRRHLVGEGGFVVLNRRGFTLLEVMVAVAILGLSLTVILSAQAGLYSGSTYAQHTSVAVGLAR